jgi:hypothetical protein
MPMIDVMPIALYLRRNRMAMFGILADNADPLAADVYAALDMPFAVLVGQIASSITKK